MVAAADKVIVAPLHAVWLVGLVDTELGLVIVTEPALVVVVLLKLLAEAYTWYWPELAELVLVNVTLSDVVEAAGVNVAEPGPDQL